MNIISLIDDDISQGETYKSLIELELDDNWSVDLIEPFCQLDEYEDYVKSKNIKLIIADERLTIKATVDYYGQDVVRTIRKSNPLIPIYIVTQYYDDYSEELHAVMSETDGIYIRSEFRKQLSQYLKVMLRASQRYFEEDENTRKRITELSKKIALNAANQDDFDELTKLRLPYMASDSFSDTLKKKLLKLKELDELLDELDCNE